MREHMRLPGAFRKTDYLAYVGRLQKRLNTQDQAQEKPATSPSIALERRSGGDKGLPPLVDEPWRSLGTPPRRSPSTSPAASPVDSPARRQSLEERSPAKSPRARRHHRPSPTSSSPGRPSRSGSELRRQLTSVGTGPRSGFPVRSSPRTAATAGDRTTGGWIWPVKNTPPEPETLRFVADPFDPKLIESYSVLGGEVQRITEVLNSRGLVTGLSQEAWAKAAARERQRRRELQARYALPR